MKREKGHILLSQGEVRPGSVMGQHWGLPLRRAETAVAAASAWTVTALGPVNMTSSVMPVISLIDRDVPPPYPQYWSAGGGGYPPVPARRPNYRLSNPVPR